MLTAMRIVFPAKGNVAVHHRENAAIANRYPVRIAGKISQNLLRAAERGLGINYPLAPVGLVKQSLKTRSSLESREGSVKMELAFALRFPKKRQELATEQAAEDLHWQ